MGNLTWREVVNDYAIALDVSAGNRTAVPRHHAASFCSMGVGESGRTWAISPIEISMLCRAAASITDWRRHAGIAPLLCQLFMVLDGTPSFAAIGRMPPNFWNTLRGEAFWGAVIIDRTLIALLVCVNRTMQMNAIFAQVADG